MREEICWCHFMRYFFWLAARDLLYAPPKRQNSIYHGFYYTSCEALAGTWNRSMGPPWGLIWWPIAPRADALLLVWDKTCSVSWFGGLLFKMAENCSHSDFILQEFNLTKMAENCSHSDFIQEFNLTKIAESCSHSDFILQEMNVAKMAENCSHSDFILQELDQNGWKL